MSTVLAAIFVIALLAGVVALLERTNRRNGTRPRFPIGGDIDPQLRRTWIHGVQHQ